MSNFYLFFIIIAVIISIIIIITFGIFGYILYNKYIYLFKIIQKMENEKYLWPLNKKISNGIINYINKKGNTLLIGVGNCSILDCLVKKMDNNAKIDVIDSNKYLLELAKEKYGERCNYIEGDFIFYKFPILYDNIVSSLPHKEFVLEDIDKIFNKYFSLSTKNIIYFESKIHHVKNSYVKMLHKNNWKLTTVKSYNNIPPVNLCIMRKNL